VGEDRGLERPQVRTGLQAELVQELPSRPAVDREGFCLPARPVERDHELFPQTLPRAVLIDQRLELSEEIRMTPQSQIGVDPRLQAADAQLVQSSRLRLSERLIHDVGESGPAP
jgi:hypothetical protein